LFGLLFGRIGPARHKAGLAILHFESAQESPHLGPPPPHAGLRGDHLLGLRAGVRRVLAKVLLQTCRVGLQAVGASCVAQLLQPVHPVLLKGPQIAPQGRLADLTYPADQVVWQGQALEIDRFHFALHFGVRMQIALGGQCGPIVVGKGGTNHAPFP
jgi:hypothetical protein